MSVIAIFTTVKDKIRAKRGGERTPEKTLLLISAFGGSLAMLLTMFIIRHKTKHAKFMAGIPIILTLQIIAIFYLHSLGILI